MVNLIGNFIFSALQKLGFGDKFINMTKVAFTKIQSKIKINGLLPNSFTLMRGVHQGCPLSMPISLIRIKGIRIGDHEIKIVNFADDTTIFLTDITYINRTQVTLKLYEDASSSEINFSKAKPYGLEHIKIELINQDKWNRHNFSLKFLELILVTLSSITPIGTK